MKEITIADLAYHIKESKKNNKPQPIFFLGAGASKSGDIPLADEIIEDILGKFPDNPTINKIPKEERSYAKLMDCLLPFQRNELLKQYVKKAKINVTHIYLAQLLKCGYVDYVLTVNFDNLMLRALSLYNIFPSTYDMAILKELTTTTFREKSIVYLHGQHHGLWLLNTKDEMAKVKATAPRIFDSVKNERPWIFIGYSGSDPIFDHIKELGRFDNGLYWIGYKDGAPQKKVKEFLDKTDTNAFYIKGYDSDAFMLKLNEILGLAQPEILDKPFSSLRTMLNNINDINEEEHFKGVKERLEMAKSDVDTSIKQFEMKEKVSIKERELKIGKLKKDIIDILISESYDERTIKTIEDKATKFYDKGVFSLLSELYMYWGNSLFKRISYSSGELDEEYFVLANEKYEKAIQIKPNSHEVFYNWGTNLMNFADSKEDKDTEKLYLLANEKYCEAIKIKPDFQEAFYNLGNNYSILAKFKKGEEAEELYLKAINMYTEATKIKSDCYQAFHNWGINLASLAELKDIKESDHIYLEAFNKFQKAIEIKPDFHEALNNWGSYLINLALSKQGSEAEKLFLQALEKLNKAIEIKPDKHQALSNIGILLGNLAKNKDLEESEDLYLQANEKFVEAIKAKPDYHVAYSNWGVNLTDFAEVKNNKESEKLYLLANEKYNQATKLDPTFYDAFYNWGVNLTALAKITEGENAEKLYILANEKYMKTITIKPDFHKAWYNWGTNLTELAQLKDSEEKEKLYSEALDKYSKAIEYGGKHYNLACLYAKRNLKERAFSNLDIALRNRDETIDFVLNDEDWKGYLEDPEFLSVINKYR